MLCWTGRIFGVAIKRKTCCHVMHSIIAHSIVFNGIHELLCRRSAGAFAYKLLDKRPVIIDDCSMSPEPLRICAHFMPACFLGREQLMPFFQIRFGHAHVFDKAQKMCWLYALGMLSRFQVRLLMLHSNTTSFYLLTRVQKRCLGAPTMLT